MKLILISQPSVKKSLSEETLQSRIPSGNMPHILEKVMLQEEYESPFARIGGNKIRTVIPTLEIINKILTYDPNTGVFLWKENGGARRRLGKIAGSVCKNGYRYIGIGKERFIAAHLAWYITYKEWPSAIVDHVNGDRDDNRLVNLRLVDKQTNAENSKSKKRKTYGIYKHRNNKYRVQLYINKQHKHFGVFNSFEEAQLKVEELRLFYGI